MALGKPLPKVEQTFSNKAQQMCALLLALDFKGYKPTTNSTFFSYKGNSDFGEIQIFECFEKGIDLSHFVYYPQIDQTKFMGNCGTTLQQLLDITKNLLD